MFTFKTELFGLAVEVEGEFTPAEAATIDCPGWPAEFEIDTIKHKGDELEVDQGFLDAIEKKAFDAAHDQHDPY